MRKRPIFTIGHSTRSIEQFMALLKAHGIEEVVDVRTIPRSRRNPQFNKEKLSAALRKANIRYAHLEKLGGLRRANKNSINLGWRNASFRGFADYMQTSDFGKGLAELMKIAKAKKTAIMCAEAVPWRCHRSLIADALVKKKWRVLHIQSAKTAKPHALTPFLRMKAGRIIYPVRSRTPRGLPRG